MMLYFPFSLVIDSFRVFGFSEVFNFSMELLCCAVLHNYKYRCFPME